MLKKLPELLWVGADNMTRDQTISLLEYMQSLHVLKLNRIIGNYYSVTCPFHSDGNERRPSAGILLEDEVRAGAFYAAGWFHCFTCSTAKSLTEWVTDLLQRYNISTSAIEVISKFVPEFNNTYEYEPLIPMELMSSLNSKYALQAIQQMTQSAPKYVSEAELATYRYIVPYMKERKLTDRVIDLYDVGYDANYVPPGRKRPVPCITFPVRDANGNTLFICRRSIQGKTFYMPFGVTKPVYGLDCLPKTAKSVIVCESIINALTAVGWGYPAIALLGTGTDYQMNQLKQTNISEYILCFDGDEAGHRATSKFKKKMSKVAIIWSVTMPEGKDVNNLTQSEFEALLKTKE